MSMCSACKVLEEDLLKLTGFVLSLMGMLDYWKLQQPYAHNEVKHLLKQYGIVEDED